MSRSGAHRFACDKAKSPDEYAAGMEAFYLLAAIVQPDMGPAYRGSALYWRRE